MAQAKATIPEQTLTRDTNIKGQPDPATMTPTQRLVAAHTDNGTGEVVPCQDPACQLCATASDK